MKLSEAQIGDRVKVPFREDGRGAFGDKKVEKIVEATIAYAGKHSVVLHWQPTEIPIEEATHPRFVFEIQKQRGAIPKDFVEPTSGYAISCQPQSVECELIFRKTDWSKGTTLRDARAGDRVILPVDANNEMILDATKAVGTTTGTVLMTESQTWYPRVGWRRGDKIPKNAKMVEVYGGFVACASLSIDANKTPCIILPPEEVKEPKETPKAKSEEVKVEPTQEVSTSKDTIVIDSLYLLQPEQEPTAQDHKESSFTPAIMIGAGIFGGLISAMAMMKPNIEARVEAIAETNDEPAEANELQTDVI